MPDQEEYTIEEAAALLGLGTSTVRTALAEGKMQSRKIGKRLNLISASEIERYRQEHLGGQGWAKRHEPDYQPSKMAEYYREYRARRKEREQQTEQQTEKKGE